MSLLMDALAHKQKGSPPAIKAGDFSLASPPAHPANAGRSLPNLTPYSDRLNAELEAGAPPAQSAAPVINATQAPPGEEVNRAVIHNAFAAKPTKPPARHLRGLVVSTLGFVAVGIGAYAWYQNHGLLSAANSPRPEANELLPARPAAVLQTAASPPAVPIFDPNSPLTTTLAENLERPIKPVQRTETSRGEQSNLEPKTVTSPPVRLIRTQTESDPHLQRAYANLQANSLDQARRDYEQAERNDPNNVDALLGLAAIAQRQGRSNDAEHYQQRALIADPSDAGAQAAVLGNNDNAANPTNSESRLKSLLSTQPESAQLSFALGNVYAKQARWSEAQQVYFNALAGDKDNPDYLFNLAVSLDQLRQPKLAAQHYQMALAAAERRPAAFDHERASKRLSQLSP